MGMVHGARAALPHFLERGSGTLINNASLVGNCPSPFHSPYVASKFAIRGLSFALRQEMMHLPDVHVCVLSPASIDTPLWQRGANYSGRAIKPLDPAHPVKQVAEVLLNLVRYPQREVLLLVGAEGVSYYRANGEEAACGNFGGSAQDQAGSGSSARGMGNGPVPRQRRNTEDLGDAWPAPHTPTASVGELVAWTADPAT